MQADIKELAKFKGLPMALAGSGACHSATNTIDSSPRKMMTYNQVGQSTVIRNSNRRRFGSGSEVHFGKFVEKIKFKHDSTVKAIIPKYRSHRGQGALDPNITGKKTLIVETDRIRNNGYELDVITLDPHKCHDTTFGYEMVPNKEVLSSLAPNRRFPAGTDIYKSPNVDPYGNWSFSCEAMIAYLDMPWCIEDGFGVRRGWLKNLIMTGYGKRHGTCGENCFPLNLYGDKDNYKIMPDYGEKVRKDGLLMAFRIYDPLLNAAQCTWSSCQQVDRDYDILVYAKPGAIVTDITVIESPVGTGGYIPETMEAQLRKYSEAQVRADSEMHEYLKTLNEENFSNQLHNMFVSKKPRIGEKVFDGGKPRVSKLARKRQVLPQWDITVQFKYDIIPSIGFKMTDFHGGKGVICHIFEDEDAPRDTLGNLVDVTQSPSSPPKRQNLGCVYEPFINAAGETCVRNLKLMQDRGASVSEMWDYYIGFIRTVDSISADVTEELRDNDGIKMAHMLWEMEHGIHFDSGTDNLQIGTQLLENLATNYPPHFEPIYVRRHNSNTEDDPWALTDQPVLVGHKSMFPLEKIGSDASATADVKLTHHGIPAKITQRDKYATPRREGPKRTAGESEVRHRMNVEDDESPSVIADHLDTASNPLAAYHQYLSILTADNPSQIERCVDRDKVPLGDGRCRAMVRDISNCAGFYLSNEVDPEDRHLEGE